MQEMTINHCPLFTLGSKVEEAEFCCSALKSDSVEKDKLLQIEIFNFMLIVNDSLTSELFNKYWELLNVLKLLQNLIFCCWFKIEM